MAGRGFTDEQKEAMREKVAKGLTPADYEGFTSSDFRLLGMIKAETEKKKKAKKHPAAEYVRKDEEKVIKALLKEKAFKEAMPVLKARATRSKIEIDPEETDHHMEMIEKLVAGNEEIRNEVIRQYCATGEALGYSPSVFQRRGKQASK